MKEHFYTKDSLASIGKLMELKPETAASFVAFDQKVFEKGALDAKTKELIAIGAAHVTRCPYCIEAHVNRAKKAGASDEEIAEAVFVGIAMNAGAAFAHSCFAMDCLKK
ncbi:MAG: carboxymuconolactone decarboxylase family protein [Syntrophales bacterium]|jgi:AhpD family alkylhydroperoxidase|nr:carboxymuconolactone decarboxylase family protein [Syntrophales bacterium]